MNRYRSLTVIFLLMCVQIIAQQPGLYGQKKKPVRSLIHLSKSFAKENADSSLFYALEAMDALDKKDSLRLRFDAVANLSNAYYRKDRYTDQLAQAKDALLLAREIGDSLLVISFSFQAARA
jgi:hypothetical protein